MILQQIASLCFMVKLNACSNSDTLMCQSDCLLEVLYICHLFL